MRKFLFSIFCATVSFLLALAPSAQAQSKSNAEDLKKAKEAEEAAKKEAAKRAKEAEKAAKKAREQEEAARKAERAEAEQKARARDEALRRARAAAAATYKSETKQADKVSTVTDDAASKARLAEAEAQKHTAFEAEKRAKAVEEARQAAELAREAAKKVESQESARKAKEAAEAAKHEASVRAAQEKEVAQSAKKTAEQLKKLNQQQEAERKAKEAELARKAKAEKEAAAKAKAEESARQAKLEAQARKDKAAQEEAARELAKETARREKAQEAAARAEAARQARVEEEARKANAAKEAADAKIAKEAARREEEALVRAKTPEEVARKADQAKSSSRSVEPARSAPSAVTYEGETFRIVKVPKDGAVSVVAPVPTPVSATQVTSSAEAIAAAEAKAKAARAEEEAKAARAEEVARSRAEVARKRAEADAARKAQEAEVSAQRAIGREAVVIEHQDTQSAEGSNRVVTPASASRGANTSRVPKSHSEPLPLPAPVAAQEKYTVEERDAAAQLRARREYPGEPASVYAPVPSAGISTARSRSSNSQARYYEELWEKELAARNGKQAKSQVVTAAGAPDDRRSQARYYEELWRKEQEAKAAKNAAQTARIKTSAPEPYIAPVEPEIRQKPSREVVVQPSTSASLAPQSTSVPQSTVDAKQAELAAEKARLNASIEAGRKNPEADTFRKVQLKTQAAEQEEAKAKEAAKKASEEAAAKKSNDEALRRAEDEARKARAQEEAARKTLEQAAAKKAKAEREAMALAEEEAAKKAKAEEAARRAAEKEVAQRPREQRSAPAEAQVQAAPAEKEGFWARLRASDKPKTPAPDVSSLLSDEERQAQDRALEALRQKQAELDAQDAQLQGRVAPPSAPSGQYQVAPVGTTVAAAPAISPEEAAKEARALAASNAELQSLKKKLSNATAEREKVAAEIQTAQKNLGTPGAAKPSGKKFEVIVDNNDARLVGTWAEGKTGGFYGKDYSFKGKGTGANYADFTPNLPAAGTYEVYEWHVAGANRAADAPYIVNYDGGSQVVSVNQQLNGGKWNSIGTFAFAAGQNGSVRITDGIGLQGQMIMADAIRFVLAGSGGNGVQVADNSVSERAIEALRIKQDALTAEENRLKTQVQAAEKRIAALQNAAQERSAASTVSVPAPSPAVSSVPATGDVHTKAEQAMRQREAELNATGTKSQSKSKKMLTVKNGAEPAPAVEPARPLTAKEQKLADLLRRYKADEITPRDYHQERAKILAEP